MELRVGSRFRLGRKIGSGSFGDIYLGKFFFMLFLFRKKKNFENNLIRQPTHFIIVFPKKFLIELPQVKNLKRGHRSWTLNENKCTSRETLLEFIFAVINFVSVSILTFYLSCLCFLHYHI